MRKTRIRRSHPSPATTISLIALVIAMSGTAYAATGGTFILGKANRATSITSLSNTNGTALALSSAHGKPPLTVSNSVQVPKLNASELGGMPAANFLLGDHSHGLATPGSNDTIPLAGGLANVTFTCGSTGLTPTGEFTLTALTNVEVWWLNKDGGSYALLNTGQTAMLAQTTQNPYTVVVQVGQGNSMTTADLSMAVHWTAENCTFAAQSFSGG